MDDVGGVYAHLQLPTWPQTSARALQAHTFRLWARARHLWAHARSIALRKVCIPAATCLLGWNAIIERLLHSLKMSAIGSGSHALHWRCCLSLGRAHGRAHVSRLMAGSVAGSSEVQERRRRIGGGAGCAPQEREALGEAGGEVDLRGRCGQPNRMGIAEPCGAAAGEAQGGGCPCQVMFVRSCILHATFPGHQSEALRHSAPAHMLLTQQPARWEAHW